MKIKKKVIGVVVVGLIGICAVVGVTSNMNKSNASTFAGNKEGSLVKVAKAEKRDIETKVSASGTLEAKKEEILFSESTNRIITINKEVGDTVKKGEVILILDKDEKEKKQKEIQKIDLSIQSAQIEVEQMQSGSKQDILMAQSKLADLEKSKSDSNEAIRSAKASLTTAKSDEETAIKNYELTQELFNQGLKSQQELDNDEKALNTVREKMIELTNKIASLEEGIKALNVQEESANYSLNVLLNNVDDKNKAQNIAMKQNAIKTSELQKQTLLEELAKSTDVIVAPIDGVIAEIKVQEGGHIAPGTELLKIIDLSQLIVKSEVSPFYASQLQEGLDATIKYNGSQMVELKGKVAKVSPTATVKQGPNDSKVTAVPIEIEIMDSQNVLKPGLVVDVRIVTNDVKDVVTVPILATMENKEGDNYILVVKEDFTIEKRMINQGAADNLAVEIKDLKEGEVVITNPTEALDDGMPVKYVPFVDETETKEDKEAKTKEDKEVKTKEGVKND